MSDDSDGEEPKTSLDYAIRDLEEAQNLFARAAMITETVTNRLKLHRERYHEESDNFPMPPDESDFIGGANKDVYSGPPPEEDSEDE